MKTNHYITLMLLMLFGVLTAQAQTNSLTIPDVSVCPGQTISLPINLDNTSDIVALQFTLTVGDGITLEPSSATLTERSDGHQVTMRNVGENKYMAMITSAKNAALIGSSGAVMKVKLTASSSLEEGTELPLTLSDVVLGALNGDNLATGVNSGKVTIIKLPDLEVSNVTTSATTVKPGDKVSVNWQVSNIGGLPTQGGWSEQILFEGTDGTVKKLSDTYYDNILSAGGVVSRNVEFVVPEILGLDGEAKVKVKLTPSSNAGEPSWLSDNNTALSNGAVNIDKMLKLSPSRLSLEETLNTPVRLYLTRSGSTAEDETFAIEPINDSRISLPESVTISKGQSGVYFYLSLKANDQLDDDSLSSINISGNGYEPVSTSIEVEDDTLPKLHLEAEDEITEGDSLKIVIEAQRAPKEDLPIIFTCDLAQRFTIPSVVLPAGETVTEIVITSKDDDVPDITQFVTFTASAQGYTSASTVIDLIDNDIPALEMTLSPDAVSEAAGPLCVLATLHRTDNIDKLVTIKLTDDSDGNLYYGYQTVQMRPGDVTVTFNLGPIDNDIVDGERTYNISASVWIASCSCNASNGTSGGTVTVPLTVYDNDGPSLSLKSNVSILKEGDELEVVVSRNTTTENALTVNIISDQDSALEYPSTVTIPAGEPSVSFTVKSLSNDITDDNFNATITAESEGYAKANIWFTVSDQTLPDAQISEFKVSETQIPAGDKIQVTATIANTGSYTLPELTKVCIYRSGEESAVETLYLQAPLAPGESAQLSKTISLPNAVGAYNVYAVANDGREVKELLYTNNTSSAVRVQVVSPYTFTITTDKNVYEQGETIYILGSVRGKDVANKPVEVYVINDGCRQVFNITTDENGSFNTSYKPYPGQIGRFIIGGCYPEEGLREELAAFDLPGIKLTDAPENLEIINGEKFTGSIEIENPSGLPLVLEKLDVKFPKNCTVDVEYPKEIPAGGKIVVLFTVTPTEISDGYDWEDITFTFETGLGTKLEKKVGYYIFNPTGKLKADVSSINTTMIKGSTRDYPFVITNIGKGETGKISLLLPEWMTAITPKEMPSMVYGESTTIILRLKPTADMQLNVPQTGRIAINCESGQGLAIPFSIEPVSDAKGILTVDVCDEDTYYSPGAPHLKGASVQITHPTTGELLASGTTDEQGKFSVNINEGYYTLSVTAANHDSYRKNILVDPGVEKYMVVNLSLIPPVTWVVEPTEVPDKYYIETIYHYQTSVPVPVIEIAVPKDLPIKELRQGESLIFHAVLTNRGLITAQDVEVIMPKGLNVLKFEPLAYTTPFALAPKQSVTVPIKVTYVVASSSSKANAAPANNAKGVEPIDNEPCASALGALAYWDCGNDRKWHRYEVALQLGPCSRTEAEGWTNGGGSSSGGGSTHTVIVIPQPGGNGGGGGGGYYPSSNGDKITTKEDKGCEPCQNKFMVALLKCVPVVGTIINGVETVGSGLNCLGEFASDDDFRTKLANCEFTEDIADALDLLDYIYGFLQRAQNANLTDEDLANVSKFIQDEFMRLAKDGAQTLVPLEEIENMSDALLSLADNLGINEGQPQIKDPGKAISDMHKLFSNFAEALEKFGATKELGEKLNGKLKKFKKLLCFTDLLSPCDLEGSPSSRANAPGASNLPYGSYPSYVEEFQRSLSTYMNMTQIEDNIRKEIFGDEQWLDLAGYEVYPLMHYLTLLDESQIATDKILPLLKPESVSEERYWNFLNRWKNTMDNIEASQQIDLNKIKGQLTTTDAYFDLLKSTGNRSFEEMLQKSLNIAMTRINEFSNSICSTITLQFNQSMVLTRQAFRGTLTVYNGHENTAMTDVRLNLIVTDQDGNLTTSHEFQITPESLYHFSGNLSFEDGWTLQAQETGTVTVLFIPTKFAAPTEAKMYSFGGTLSYVDPFSGREVNHILTPITLAVNPTPDMELTYFMQRDVIGDDPLTETIEPSAETEFALLINNKGFGDANNVKIHSKVPQIIQNDKGLLIDFVPTSAALNGQNKAFGVADVDFGTISAHSTAFAQWWFKGSLLGHFTDYDVKVTHLTSFGNPHLSLIDTISIHELIRSIEVADINNKMVGFLTNDIVDADDLPDMLYLSNGEIQPVALAQSSSVETVSKFEYTLTVNPSASGWNYGSVNDPTYGLVNLLKVVRQSDGKEMSLRNFWQTDRTLRDGLDPLYEKRIHFADDYQTASSETYTLIFEPMPDLVLDVASIEGAPAEGTIASSPVETLNVMFNKYIKPETFTVKDINLTIEGLICETSPIKISTEDNKTFTIDFSDLNKLVGDGYYVFTVETSEITDVEGFTGVNGKSVGWNLLRDGLIEITTKVNPEDAGTVKGGLSVQYGNTVTLIAEAAEGYEFSHWTIDEEVAGQDAIWSSIAIGDMTLTANFVKSAYMVEIDDDIEGGSIEGSGTGVYPGGEELSLIATPNNDYQFKCWVVDGEPYSVDSSLNLVVEKATSISAKFKYVGKYYLNKEIAKGWNWISTFTSSSQPIVKITKYVDRIVGQFEEVIKDPEFGMVGGLHSLAPGKGYKMEARMSFNWSISGYLQNLQNSPIILRRGWNWISYPYFESKNISQVLTNADEGDYLVSQYGFASYEAGNWEGSIEDFTSGEGYLYKSATDKFLMFDFEAESVSSSQTNAPALRVNAPESEVDVHKYPNTMNVIARLYDNEGQTLEGDFNIYAMSGNELRGIGKIVNDNYYITVYGDEAQEITFVVENIATTENYIANETLIFNSDIVGSRTNPFALTITDITGIDSLWYGDQKLTIYTIEGLLINRDATIDDIRKLDFGIYIINGKKYLVR